MSDFEDFYNMRIESKTGDVLTLDPMNAIFRIRHNKHTYNLMQAQSKNLQTRANDMLMDYRKTHRTTWIPCECSECSIVARIRYFISNFHDDIVAGRQISHTGTLITEDELDDDMKNWPFDDSINTYLRERAYATCVDLPDGTIFEGSSFIETMRLVDDIITQFGTEDTLRFMKLNDNALIEKLIEDYEYSSIPSIHEKPLGIDLDTWLNYIRYLHTHEWIRHMDQFGKPLPPEQDFKLMRSVIDMLNAQIMLFGQVKDKTPKHFITYNETICAIKSQMCKGLPKSDLSTKTCKRLEMKTDRFLVHAKRENEDVYRAFAYMHVQPPEQREEVLNPTWKGDVPKIVTFHEPDDTQRPVMLVNLLDEHTVDDAFGPYYAQPSAKQREWLDDWMREKKMKLSDNAKMLL